MNKKNIPFVLTLLILFLNSCSSGGGPQGLTGGGLSQYKVIPDEFINRFVGKLENLNGTGKIFASTQVYYNNNNDNFLTVSGSAFNFDHGGDKGKPNSLTATDVENSHPLIKPFLNKDAETLEDYISFYRLGGDKDNPNGDTDAEGYDKVIELHSRGGRAYFALKQSNPDKDEYEFVSIDKDTGIATGLFLGNSNTPDITKRDYIRIHYTLNGGNTTTDPNRTFFVTTINEKQ